MVRLRLNRWLGCGESIESIRGYKPAQPRGKVPTSELHLAAAKDTS